MLLKSHVQAMLFGSLCLGERGPAQQNRGTGDAPGRLVYLRKDCDVAYRNRRGFHLTGGHEAANISSPAASPMLRQDTSEAAHHWEH